MSTSCGAVPLTLQTSARNVWHADHILQIPVRANEALRSPGVRGGVDLPDPEAGTKSGRCGFAVLGVPGVGTKLPFV